MTVREFFVEVGGSYFEAQERFMTEARMLKYINKFEENSGIEELKKAIADKDSELAFRLAHTLKGVCLNLCFGNLGKAASELTELYRGKNPTEDPTPYLQAVTDEYNKVVAAIAALNS